MDPVELESLKRDAARYRWLREQHWEKNTLSVVVRPRTNCTLGTIIPTGDYLDSLVDTEMFLSSCRR